MTKIDLEEKIKEDCKLIKLYFIEASSALNNPLNKDTLNSFKKIKKELDKKEKFYSKHSNKLEVADVQTLIANTNLVIDNRVNNYISNLDQDYNTVKQSFDKGVWNSKRRINKLSKLHDKILDVKSGYTNIGYTQGVKHCKSLENSINQKIKNYKPKNNFKITKKSLKYTGLVSILTLGSICGYYCWKNYDDYQNVKEKKLAYYETKFDSVKDYYNQQDYLKADKLSEKLQSELDEESFFSNTDDLYKKVEEYDDKFIDPKVAKIKREEFYNNLKNLYSKVDNMWDNSSENEKLFVYACGIGLAIYLWRKS